MYFLTKRLIRIWRRRHAPDAGTGTPAASGPLALLMHQARYDLITSFRNPRARFFSFVFPVIFLVVLSSVFGGSQTRVDGVHVKLSVFYVAGILTMAIVSNAYGGLVILISSLRETGVLKRRRASPVPAVVLIGGQAITTVVTSAMSAVVLLLIAKLFYGIGISAPALGAIACACVVGTLAFACLGYGVSALIGNPDAAQPVVQMTLLPLWFISGVFIPVESMGRGLRDISDVFPVQYLAHGLHLATVHSSFGGSISLTDLVVMAAWAVAAAALAAWRFSWLPSGASA